MNKRQKKKRLKQMLAPSNESFGKAINLKKLNGIILPRNLLNVDTAQEVDNIRPS